jgi:hypothetical protein
VGFEVGEFAAFLNAGCARRMAVLTTMGSGFLSGVVLSSSGVYSKSIFTA